LFLSKFFSMKQFLRSITVGFKTFQSLKKQTLLIETSNSFLLHVLPNFRFLVLKKICILAKVMQKITFRSISINILRLKEKIENEMGSKILVGCVQMCPLWKIIYKFQLHNKLTTTNHSVIICQRIVLATNKP